MDVDPTLEERVFDAILFRNFSSFHGNRLPTASETLPRGRSETTPSRPIQTSLSVATSLEFGKPSTAPLKSS